MKIENFEQAQKIQGENRSLLKEIDYLEKFIDKLKDSKGDDYIDEVDANPWCGATNYVVNAEALKGASEIILESFKDRHAKNLVLFERL